MRLLRRHHTAPAIEGAQRWIMLQVLLAVMALTLFVVDCIYIVTWMSLWVLVAFNAAVYAIGALVSLLERRLRARAEAAGWRLCPNCEYPLDGQGKCPECGRENTMESLREEWTAK